MIPVLFERDEVDFQSNGIGQLPNVIESYAYEIGNAEYELNLVYPTVNDIDGYPNSIWKELKVTERQILYKPSHSRKPHAFRIYNYEIDSVAQTITVYGRSRAYDLGNNVVKTVNINNQTPQAAMNTMKANLVEPTDFDFYSDMSTTSSTKWERQSGLSTIMGEEGSLIQYWGGEVLRENTRLSLYNRVGKDNVTTLRLGKNIEQLNYDLRTDNMVTAIIPFYRYTPEGENQEEVVVTGNTVKSSKFNNYRLPYYQFVEYNEQDDNVTNLTTLNNAASKWFSEHPNVDEPTLTINVDMVDVAESTEYAELLKSLEQVNVFDTVSVYISEYDIDVVVKVVSLKYDGFNERNLEVELGSASSGLFETFVNPQFDNISKQLDEVRKIGVIAQISADGKNTNYQGSIDPNEAGLVGDDGDIYFRTVGTEKQMWQYQVNQWNLILDTSRIDVVEKEVSAIIDQAETDRTATEQAINQAIVDANTYAEQQTSALKTEVETSNGILNEAITTAQSRADAAFTDAETAKNNAFTATQTAQTAINDSATAINNAQTALDSLTTISGDLSDLDQTVQNKFTSIDGQLSNMVTQTTFNALDQKVTSQGTLISQTQTTLLSKADKTVVDAINQTVGQHTTEIEQNAQAITARLTETQINNLLGTKNYVNQTTLTATANGLNASITQVSNDLSNLEIGGRNLVIRHNEQKGRGLAGSGTTTLATYPIPDWMNGSSTMLEAIKVTPGESLVFTKDGDDYWRFNWLDSDYNYITRETPTNKEFIKIVPSDASYLWVSYPTNEKVKIERGNKATDWSPAPEDMATLEQFTTIDATVKGLQTTVGNKAEQSQVTQLAGQISSKVESSTYTSKMTQLDSAISQRVTSTTFESRITQLDNSIDLKVSNGIDGLEIGGRNLFNPTTNPIVKSGGGTFAVNDTVPYGFYAVGDSATTLVARINNVITGNGFWTVSFDLRGSQNGGGAVSVDICDLGRATFRTPSNNEYQRFSLTVEVTNYGNGSTYNFVDFVPSWSYIWVKNIKVEKGNKATDFSYAIDDAVTQINLSTEGVLIAGKRIRLDGEVTMEQAFISRLDTLTLNAVTANITNIRAQVLQANVVTSTHLQTSTATIDKLFATDAMVSRLTAKTAFINSVKAIDISADKITTGTLFGNNVTASGINVSTIVGNISNFIQSNWNGLSSTVSITASGMRGYSNTWGESLYQGGRLDFTITDPNDRSNYSVGLDPYKIQFSNSGWGKTNIRGQSEGLLIRPELTNTGAGLNSSIHLSGNITYLQFNDLGNNGVRGRIEVSANSTRFMSGNIVHFTEYNSPGVYQRTQALAYYTYDSVNTYNNMAIIGNRIQFVNENSNSNIYITPAINGKLVIGKSSSAVWYNVECLTVTQKSTRRIKDNIIPLANIGLNTVNTLTVVEYDLKQNLARGIFEKQIGFIFEDSPSIANKEGESIDLGRVGAINTKAIQELSVFKDDHELRLKALEQENKELKAKIQQLESVA